MSSTPAFIQNEHFQEFLQQSRDHCNLMVTEKKLANYLNQDHPKDYDAIAHLLHELTKERKNLFIKACEKLGHFVFQSGLNVKCSEIDDYLASIQSDEFVVRLLARKSHVPQGCRLMYRDQECQFQIWVVITPYVGYLEQEAQLLGCNWLNVEQRRVMREKLDDAGFVVVFDDSMEKRREMAREMEESGDGHLEFVSSV